MDPIFEWILVLCALASIWCIFKAVVAISKLKEGETVSSRPIAWPRTRREIYNHLKNPKSWMSPIRKEMPFGMALIRLLFLGRAIVIPLYIGGRYFDLLPGCHDLSPTLYSLESVISIIAFISINKRYKWGWGLIIICELYDMILRASFHYSLSDSVLPSMEGSFVHLLGRITISTVIVVYTVRNRSYFNGGK